MIKYPDLKDNFTIGITAPSSGIEDELHYFVDEIKERFRNQAKLVFGKTTFNQHKAKSADAVTRANELNQLFQNDEIDIIIPPWGGGLAIEILDKIDYENLPTKWILGYSDISLIMLAITLKTGIATAHGTNIVDLRGKYSDDTTEMWRDVLSLGTGDEIVQHSSKEFQSTWNHEIVSDYIFNFDRKTEWKSIDQKSVEIEGRLLGGCIDVIHHLVGTPYGDVKHFQKEYISNEPIIWYLENADASPTDFRRMLLQMKYAGWFENCSGILFGRTPVKEDVEGYTIEDVYHDIFKELEVPVIYDVDCGHLPPQNTFVNGAYGIVEYSDGKGTVTQRFT